ncbi:unnamed protein product [Heligmosomoides polygyrus]|uniref:EGF-like domain-containing protein n=1 Tax=Heligmosomoides polygyrus TaxID=6339 RepID=A0A183FYW8_HELPZ|nr:unnamed protein product [Heligmosomoides polygyrus]
MSSNRFLLLFFPMALGKVRNSEIAESGWSSIRWLLKPDSLLCTISPNNSSRAVFPLSSGSRSFSVRIKAGTGPLCIRDLRIQNERSVGCPPHLAVSSFSSLHLNCSCPFEDVFAAERRFVSTSLKLFNVSAATDPPFPLFELGGSEPSAMPVWTVSPCADFICMNNGTCVVAQEGTVTCLCRDGFIGAICEIDLCSSVPCQNGGRCQATGGEARCECLPNFTGILCESVAEVCQMPCMNGMCVIEDNKERCECRQGFMGVSCSVVDVCLG